MHAAEWRYRKIVGKNNPRKVWGKSGGNWILKYQQGVDWPC